MSELGIEKVVKEAKRYEDIETGLVQISRWVDEYTATRMNEFSRVWVRCAKVAEESGEVIEALLAWQDGNPRKKSRNSLDMVEKELLDTAVAALGAVAHLHGNRATGVMLLLRDHVQKKVASIERFLIEEIVTEATKPPVVKP